MTATARARAENTKSREFGTAQSIQKSWKVTNQISIIWFYGKGYPKEENI